MVYLTICYDSGPKIITGCATGYIRVWCMRHLSHVAAEIDNSVLCILDVEIPPSPYECT